jgi:hypothetical protein
VICSAETSAMPVGLTASMKTSARPTYPWRWASGTRFPSNTDKCLSQPEGCWASRRCNGVWRLAHGFGAALWSSKA